MAKNLVNLDSLIRREDFRISTPDATAGPSSLANTLKVTELSLDSFTYHVLRKPDFQRETANWTPEKVAELVESFLEGDLIPSIILWRSPESGNIFVIDGAHRLSALAAWVNDDYGDKDISIRFFANNIPREQKKAAEAARSLIGEAVGSYRDLSSALRSPEASLPKHLRLARNLSAFALHLQWVVGEAYKAEDSFFKINQHATPIDPTELGIIKARRKPNALAARAFIRAGTGHKYWSDFDDQTQAQIEQIAQEVYDLIFKPDLETSIRSADLPVAGRGYSSDSLKMVFELVNFVNDLKPEMWQRLESDGSSPGKSEGGFLADDQDGSSTIRFMQAVRRAAGRVAGNSPASLGLHPAVYFYGSTGRFQAAAFLASVQFTMELDKSRTLAKFTEVRSAFEDFLVRYKFFRNQLVSGYGGLQRALPPILLMYRTLLEALVSGVTADEAIIAKLKEQPRLKSHLKIQSDEDRRYGRNFSSETKNTIYLTTSLDSALRCAICSARVPKGSMSIDHILRKEDGGTGAPENGQVTHPYCNTGYKEMMQARRGS
ncbi:HNH endonuclease family protein [Micromonospora zamorensis]|uniref:HNH endonuclease family protein n=1 Tax=Micromonospora zamorensis TaxID=709883 RepID=UPI003CEA0E47